MFYITIFLLTWILLLYLIFSKKYFFKLSVYKIFIFLGLLPTIFGVFYLSLFNGAMSFGVEDQISQSIKNIVLISYCLTWAFIFIFLGFSRQLTMYQYELSLSDEISRNVGKHSYKVIFIFLIIILFELIRVPSIPLLVFITDGASAGSISRGEVITYQIENGIPILGYFLVFFPSLAVIWLYFLKLKGEFSKNIFWIIVLIYTFYYLLFLGKGFFITPLLICFLIKSLVFNKPVSFLAPFALIAFSMPLFFLASEGSIQEVINLFLNRAFVVQSEGMFWIREFYTAPSIEATMYGMPFNYLFGISGFDPSVEVVKILFGDVTGWVNANSFFVGQGWVMLGNSIIILGPLLIILNIFLIKLTFPLFKYSRKYYFLHVIALYVIITLPINTNFALLLYLKPFFNFLINATLAEWLIFRPLKIK